MKNGKLWIANFLNIIPKKQLLLSLFYGILRIGFSAVWPFYLYKSLKEMGTHQESQLLMDILIVVVFLVLIAIVSNLQSKINIGILKAFTLDLADRIWKKMNSLDWLTFHGKNRVYYFDMLMVETWRVRSGIVAVLESIIINSFIAGVLSLFIVFISWQLFLVCLCGLMLMGIGHYLSIKKNRPLLKEFHEAWRTQHHWIAKCVDQFNLIKMDRGYESSKADNLKNSGTFLSINSNLLNSQAQWRNINQLIANVVRIGVFVVGIYWVRTGLIRLEDLLLVLLIVSIVQSNVMQIPSALNSFIEAQEASKTISSFFGLKDEEKDDGHPLSNSEPVKKITIRDLSVGYEDKTVFKGVDFDLQAGKIYIWRGPNGSGKSTAAHILLGLIQPHQGKLIINDQQQDWGNLRFFRHRFAFLNQDSQLFMGSIKENLLFGHVNSEKAWNMLHTTWLSNLLFKSAKNGDKMVGERGEGLSGGEAKRIALIRELLRSSDLLILDEPLNHLDELAINEIKKEILAIKANTIVVIISHQTGFESIADEIKQF
jgi:ABC-type bacteriocin/lantibiotic exporter with double-glycine peptidase domain